MRGRSQPSVTKRSARRPTWPLRPGTVSRVCSSSFGPRMPTLNVIVKADAQGSLEALRESIVKIEREGGKIQIVHTAVGGINENDVTLAEVTEAVIVGFNVRPEPKARRAAEAGRVEIRTYGIIYELLDEIEQLLVGQLAPTRKRSCSARPRCVRSSRSPRRHHRRLLRGRG